MILLSSFFILHFWLWLIFIFILHQQLSKIVFCFIRSLNVLVLFTHCLCQQLFMISAELFFHVDIVRFASTFCGFVDSIYYFGWIVCWLGCVPTVVYRPWVWATVVAFKLKALFVKSGHWGGLQVGLVVIWEPGHALANVHVHSVSALLDRFVGVSCRVWIEISHRHPPNLGKVSWPIVVFAHVESLWMGVDDLHICDKWFSVLIVIKVGLFLQAINWFAVYVVIITLLDNLLNWIALNQMVRAVGDLLVLEAKVFALLRLRVVCWHLPLDVLARWAAIWVKDSSCFDEIFVQFDSFILIRIGNYVGQQCIRNRLWVRSFDVLGFNDAWWCERRSARYHRFLHFSFVFAHLMFRSSVKSLSEFSISVEINGFLIQCFEHAHAKFRFFIKLGVFDSQSLLLS